VQARHSLDSLFGPIAVQPSLRGGAVVSGCSRSGIEPAGFFQPSGKAGEVCMLRRPARSSLRVSCRLHFVAHSLCRSAKYVRLRRPLTIASFTRFLFRLVILSCPEYTCRSPGAGLHRKIEFAEASWYGYGSSIPDISRPPVSVFTAFCRFI
jgi:hypothetical protein